MPRQAWRRFTRPGEAHHAPAESPISEWVGLSLLARDRPIPSKVKTCLDGGCNLMRVPGDGQIQKDAEG